MSYNYCNNSSPQILNTTDILLDITSEITISYGSLSQFSLYGAVKVFMMSKLAYVLLLLQVSKPFMNCSQDIAHFYKP